MPDRDYYLSADKEVAATREAYKKYLAEMLGIAGISDPERAAAVFALESRIAQAHWSAAERREADKTYNPMTLAQLAQLAPQFPWSAFLGAKGIPLRAPHGERQVDVGEKSAFPKLAAVFAATPVAVWRDYLTVRFLHKHAAYLPRQVDGTDFAFYGTVLSGQKQPLPRELRAIRMLDQEMGEALGKLYCAAYFPPEAKARSRTLVANLMQAYENDIQSLAWMTPATRQKALEKVHSFQLKIGYPDTWRDYSALTIRANELVADIHSAEAFDWNRQLARLDAPVDRSEWYMTAPTNNAYYDPSLNEIAFPAGVLQPPYFDPNADDAANYGAIGATIGHEMSHAFDDQGSKYDAAGRLRNWWTAEDRRNFDARTRQLALQYDRYEALPGLHVNGKLTLGENIADLAGRGHRQQGLSPGPGRQAGAGAQRLQRRPALLHRLRPELAGDLERGAGAAHRTLGRAQPLGLPGQRGGAQRCGLVRRLRAGTARGCAVPGPGGARGAVVRAMPPRRRIYRVRVAARLRTVYLAQPSARQSTNEVRDRGGAN